MCKLVDWITKEEIVAEGRWTSKEPNTLVNGFPIGPNAVKVFVDMVLKPDTFLWRPTAVQKTIQDSFKSFVIWPANRVEFVPATHATPQSQQETPQMQTKASELQKSATPPSPPIKRCKQVMDSPVRRSPVI